MLALCIAFIVGVWLFNVTIVFYSDENYLSKRTLTKDTNNAIISFTDGTPALMSSVRESISHMDKSYCRKTAHGRSKYNG